MEMLWAEVCVVNKNKKGERVSELWGGKQEKRAAGRFSAIFGLSLKESLSALRKKKKQAKAYKNHMHFKYCQFLDVRIKPY